MNTPATTISQGSTATKACPYCGEQILPVAVKCKHCGSNLTDSPPSAASAVKSQFKMRPTYAVLLVIIVAVFAAAWLYNLSRTGTLLGSGFSDADVASIQQSIRTDFAKRGVTVEEVQLIKESPRKLTGFANINVPSFGTVHKTCGATMDDRRQIIWQCQ